MIRQAGAPTFALFETEIHWKEVITAIKPQQNEQVIFDELDLSSKCEILRSNRVMTTWMFQKPVEALFIVLSLSFAQPLGKVVDYFYSLVLLEFQHRGVHTYMHRCTFYALIEGTPVFEED